MPYWIDWEKHFQQESPENRNRLKKALTIVLADEMISKYFDGLRSVDAILSSVKIQNDE